MRNPCKVPFRERVPKQRLPKVYFAGFFHRVAWSAAPWDPIVFPAKVHIGITRSYQRDQLPIWTCRVAFGLRGLHSATVLETLAQPLGRAAINRQPPTCRQLRGYSGNARFSSILPETTMARRKGANRDLPKIQAHAWSITRRGCRGITRIEHECSCRPRTPCT